MNPSFEDILRYWPVTKRFNAKDSSGKVYIIIERTQPAPGSRIARTLDDDTPVNPDRDDPDSFSIATTGVVLTRV